MTVAEALKRFRATYKLSQKEVAEKLGMIAQSYCRYETGQYSPRADDVIKLAQDYGVTTDYLLGLSDEPRPAPDAAKLIRAMLDCRDLIQDALDSKVQNA